MTCTSRLSTRSYTHACTLAEGHDGQHISADGFWWQGAPEDDEPPSGALPSEVSPGVWVVGGELDEEQIAMLARARAAIQDDGAPTEDDDASAEDERENPALVLRVYATEGRVKLGTSKLSREQAATILMHIAEDILDIEDWKDDEVDLRNY